MDEHPGGDSPQQPSSTRRLTRSPLVAGFPGWTHLVAALAFPVWSIGTDAYLYGIDARYDWWQGFGTLMTVLIVSVLLIVLPPAVALEAWAVIRRKNRWVARGPVICYVLIAGFVSFLPTGLRFGGDNSPTAIDLVTLSLASYGIVIGVQVLCAYLACRLGAVRRTPRLRSSA